MIYTPAVQIWIYKKNEIIKAATTMEFHPVEVVGNNQFKSYTKIPLTEISGLGAAFAEMVPEFRTITGTTTITTCDLWKCTFPAGVKGKLTAFKDGSGYTGAIMNKDGIAGQARWNRVNKVAGKVTYTVPVSPLNMFMAAALVEINHEIDGIEKLGHEILDYQIDHVE